MGRIAHLCNRTLYKASTTKSSYGDPVAGTPTGFAAYYEGRKGVSVSTQYNEQEDEPSFLTETEILLTDLIWVNAADIADQTKAQRVKRVEYFANPYDLEGHYEVYI